MVNLVIQKPSKYVCESDHYLIDDKKYWRVTKVKSVINQPSLNMWRSHVGNAEANKIMKERQNIGTKMHKLFELTLLGEKINLNDYKNKEIKDDLELFNIFTKDCDIKDYVVEQHLWSEKYKIAGTPDYVGMYKSNSKYLKRNVEPRFEKSSLVIGDWKSSSGIYKDYWIQLASYAAILEEMTGIKVDGAFIAQFRNGKIKIEEQTYDELTKYFGVMLHCIELFKYTKGVF